MSNVLQKITARAKQIRRASPSKKWTDCIKQASRELKSGTTAKKSVAAAKRKPSKSRQTGGSNLKKDRKRPARTPGKRLSKTGKVYYERRKNRSDKPGALSGLSAASLKGALRMKLEEKLGKAFVQKTKAATKRLQTKIQKQITLIKADLKKLK